MRKGAWCLFGLLLVSSTTYAQGKSAADDSARSLVSLETQWIEAVKSHNAAAVAQKLDDRLVIMDSSGQLSNKAQGLASLKTIAYSSAEDEDVQVTLFGDTAVVTGGFRGKGTDSTGKTFDVHERWVDTWLKLPGGHWKCIASASAPLAD